MKIALDKDKSIGAIFTDLSNRFDTLNLDLLIANLKLEDSPKILLR